MSAKLTGDLDPRRQRSAQVVRYTRAAGEGRGSQAVPPRLPEVCEHMRGPPDHEDETWWRVVDASDAATRRRR